nr:glycoside hydrolase family 27 protein [uncultured Cellulosilyticum sp.]
MKLAQTPPMGWNSWDCYGASVTEATVRSNAEFMANHLKQYGWQYIVVDIQWYEPTAENHEYHKFVPLEMDEYSRLLPAVNRFPSAKDGQGFKPLADYIHSLGLKFGIHIMRGIPRQAAHQHSAIKGTSITANEIANPNDVCEWNPDMYGIHANAPGAAEYYNSLFELYASWGVDFVKVDDICREFRIGEIQLIHNAIKNSGREMILSLSPGPAPLEHAEEFKELANMWRITDDFWDKWELLYDMFSRSEKWCTHSGPGSWPDCDMLPIGPILQDYKKENWTKFTKDEQITMLTLWCMMRSPLIIGGDMTGFDDFTMRLLTNEALLEIVNHTHSAHQLFRRGEAGKEQIAWFTTHEEKGYYLALFNCDNQEATLTATLPIDGTYNVYDIWAKEEIGSCTHVLSAKAPAHGAKVYRLLPCE